MDNLTNNLLKYAQVVFPQPFRNLFTYLIPDELLGLVKVGVRVVVPFGKRTLTGFVVALTNSTEVKEKIKPIKDVLDEKPIFDEKALKFYEWISEYYISSLGEALRNSVPYGTEVESKKKVVADKIICRKLFDSEKRKDSLKAKVLSKLMDKEINSVSQIQKAVKNKNIYSVLRSLEKLGAVSIIDDVIPQRVKEKKIKHVSLAKSIDEIYNTIPELERKSPKQIVILLELISQKEKEIPLQQLIKKTNTNYSVINSLVKKGFISIYEKRVERVYSEIYTEKSKEIQLSERQKYIIDKIGNRISSSEFESFLLHGITGSGKTQVYIELSKIALSKGKDIIILVPEISLTPQITARFFNHFGDKVTVIHSRLSLGERYDAWRGIINGKFKIVIGARSALFAPLKNLGLIVVDEEHDQSYKQQEMIPKYHARDAAIVLAKLNNCPVVLGSATPSIESMYNALTGKFTLLELPERIDNAKLPIIRLVDVTIEKKKKQMENIFSRILLNEIIERLGKKEGVIILQNRRGFATQVFCGDCGEVIICPNCSVSMVHHINKNVLKCHYCGTTVPVPKACPVCGSIALKFFGTGTQRVEDELGFYLPNVKIERIDSDTIDRKGKLSEILNRFAKGEVQILVGTQMVSKGLDFANVTLVGVISAETTLWLPDFRADERTFQLLTQVAGRSGRSKSEGEVIIQTQNHKHFVLQKVLMNDYKGFYENEIKLRLQGEYPPFTRLALVEMKDENEKRLKAAINEFFELLKKYKKGIKLTPPHEAVIYKIKGSYRYQIILKCDKKIDSSGKLMRTALLNSYVEYIQKSKFKDIRPIIDVDPQSII
ncbi:primosomal protein N' [Melioribacteraceae bacterium 4301-Me]|uniref:primosomal protein N' n=1 Tax=Pyranulibacter aquaticus TaxID=3163344 RepID=UPI0035993EF1